MNIIFSRMEASSASILPLIFTFKNISAKKTCFKWRGFIVVVLFELFEFFLSGMPKITHDNKIISDLSSDTKCSLVSPSPLLKWWGDLQSDL